MKMKKLLIFGDSILKGITYVPELESYHILKGARFSKLREKGVEIENHSRMGSTISRGLREIKKYVTGDMTDTAVIIGYGGNDCNFDWRSVSDHPDEAHFPKIREDEFSKEYVDCLNHCADHGADVYVTTMVPLDSRKFTDWVSRGNDKNKILGWLGDISMPRRWHEHYNNLVMCAALQSRAGIIDVRTPFLLSHDFDQLICADGIHPTEKGHRLVEGTITDALLG
jgi:lysophospholipase L1-like esterase